MGARAAACTAFIVARAVSVAFHTACAAAHGAAHAAAQHLLLKIAPVLLLPALLLVALLVALVVALLMLLLEALPRALGSAGCPWLNLQGFRAQRPLVKSRQASGLVLAGSFSTLGAFASPRDRSGLRADCANAGGALRERRRQ